jgi:hypothetical protein
MIHAAIERIRRGATANQAARSPKPALAWRRPSVRATLGLALLLGIPVAGQSPISGFPPTTNTKSREQFPNPNGPPDQDSNPRNQKRIQFLNAQRQKDIVSDTEKLLKLARELNDEVAADDSEHLSDDQMRKIAEIGKLAKNVKEKMSYSVSGYPSLNTPLTTPPGLE